MKNEREFVWEYKGKLIHLHECEIYYIHLEDRVIYVHTKTNVYPIGTRINEMEEDLKGRPFIRPHYSYLVHLRYVQVVSRDELIMRNGVRVPVSKTRKKQVRDTVRDYFSDQKNCKKPG